MYPHLKKILFLVMVAILNGGWGPFKKNSIYSNGSHQEWRVGVSHIILWANQRSFQFKFLSRRL